MISKTRPSIDGKLSFKHKYLFFVKPKYLKKKNVHQKTSLRIRRLIKHIKESQLGMIIDKHKKVAISKHLTKNFAHKANT